MNMRALGASATVLMYSPDTIGLGHMRRNTAIAAGIVERIPGVSNLLLVGSSAGPYFDLPPGADCIKLPSVLKTGANTWQAKSLNIPNQTALDLRSRIIMETAAVFSPDVFLVDHVPNGIWGELLPALRLLRSMPTRPKLILGLRDILGDPKEVCASWERENVYNLIDEFYDHILIYGNRDIYPTCELYGLRQRFADRIRYCGYVCFDTKAPPKEVAKQILNQDDCPRIVVTAGGGHDAFPMMNAVLDCVTTLPVPLPIGVTMITGPLMPLVEKSLLMEKARTLGIALLTSTSELHVHMSAADLVVTMGGYNTVMEAVRVGTPTLVIPRMGPSAEQRTRAHLFNDLGLIRCLDLAEATPTRLGRTILDLLSSSKRAALSLQFTGLSKAAEELASLLSFSPFDTIASENWCNHETLVA